MKNVPLHWFTKTVGKTQRASNSLDSGNGVIVTYADYLANIGMKLDAKGGGEAGYGGRMNSQSPYRIYVRGSPDIIPTDRIIFSGRTFDVQNVNNTDEINVFTSCDCVEVDPSSTASVVSVTGDSGGGGPFIWLFDTTVVANNSVGGTTVFELFDTGDLAWHGPNNNDTGNFIDFTATLTFPNVIDHYTLWRVQNDNGAIISFYGGLLVANGTGLVTSS